MSKRTSSAAGMGSSARPAAGLAALLALGIVATGCGGSGHKSSTAPHRVKTAAVAKTSPSTTSPPEVAPTTSSSTASPTTPPTTAAPPATVVAAPPAPMWVLTSSTRAGGVVPERLVGVDPGTGALSGRSFAVPAVATLELAVIAPGDGEAYFVEAAQLPSKSPRALLVPMSLTTGAFGTPVVLSSSIAFLATSAAFSPDGSTLYLADAGDGDLLPVNLATGAVEPAITIGGMGACGDVTSAVAITPSGQDAYVESLGRFYDVNLATRVSSPAFTYPQLYGNDSFGDPSISLNPAGTGLYALESGQTADRIGVIRTAGDSAGPIITVPVVHQNVGRSMGAPRMPNWDKLYVPTQSTALVIAYGADPESIIPVNLTTGTAGPAVPVESVSSVASCGDSPSIPVAITEDGSTAIAGVPGEAAVRSVDLSTGVIGGPVSVASSGQVMAVLSPEGYSDTAQI